MKVVGLRQIEFDLLCVLGNTEGMRMAKLAQEMLTTPSSLTRICESMERRNLVKRARSPTSDREVIACLTDEGQALFDLSFTMMVDFTTQLIDTGLSLAEQERVATLLATFCANITEPPVPTLPEK